MITEATIDFDCKQDLECRQIQKESSFRLPMAEFYRISPRRKIESVRIYSIHNPAYQVSTG